MADSQARVQALAAAEADRAQVDLLDVQLKGSGQQQVVRVVVDRKGGVSLDTCQDLSRALSAALDDADPIPGRYTLEVTSPGVDRPLRHRRDFDRVEGRAVLVHREDDRGRMLQVRGTVRGAHDDYVLLEVDGEELPVAYGDIVKASQTLPW